MSFLLLQLLSVHTTKTSYLWETCMLAHFVKTVKTVRWLTVVIVCIMTNDSVCPGVGLLCGVYMCKYIRVRER